MNRNFYILARFKQCASILDFMMRAEVRCNGIPLCLGQEGKKTHLLDNYVKESEVPSLVSDKDKFSFQDNHLRIFKGGFAFRVFNSFMLLEMVSDGSRRRVSPRLKANNYYYLLFADSYFTHLRDRILVSNRICVQRTFWKT